MCSHTSNLIQNVIKQIFLYLSTNCLKAAYVRPFKAQFTQNKLGLEENLRMFKCYEPDVSLYFFFQIFLLRLRH